MPRLGETETEPTGLKDGAPDDGVVWAKETCLSRPEEVVVEG